MVPEPIDPGAVLTELGRIKLAETDLDGVLQRVADLAGRGLPGADEVSVTLLRDGRAHTAAYTGNLALILDEWQYATGDGPCLVAAAQGETMIVEDLADESRWPQWAERAAAAGVGSVLSIALPIQQAIRGALNIYGGKPEAFDDDAVLLAQRFAGYAAVALANAYLYDTTASLAQHMRTAMESRAVIEQAKGIIMGERRCTAEQAFAILTKISQDTNRKLRDVAAALVARAATQRHPSRSDTPVHGSR